MGQVISQALDHAFEAILQDLVNESIREVLKNDALGSQLKHAIRGKVLDRLRAHLK